MVPNNRIHHLLSDTILPLAGRTIRIPEESRIHALLHERLIALGRSRRGLWSRLWRFVWRIKG
jgi:hypothetical protein